MKNVKQTKRKLRRLFRGSLTLAMAFVVATSTVATAYATYQTLVPVGGDQKVNIDHIWVDNGNLDNTRPDKVEGEVTAKDYGEKDENGNPSGANIKPSGSDDYKPSDTLTDKGPNAGKDPIPNGGDNPNLNDGDDPNLNDGDDPDLNDGDDPNLKPPIPDEPLIPDDPNPNDPESGEGGDPKPSEGGESKPGEGGESKPGEGGESKPGEGDGTTPGEGGATEPPKASKDPLKELDNDVQNAIKDILEVAPINPEDKIVKDLSGEDNKKKVDTITGKLLDGTDNVWQTSQDYVAKVEDSTGVKYEVELTDDTKQALEKAGYDSVQLKITYESIYNLVNWSVEKGSEKVTDPISGKEVLIKRTYVSYDGGKTFQAVGGPEKSVNGGEKWEPYDPKTEYQDGVDKNDSDGIGKDPDTILNEPYDHAKTYVKETTYTFMHVLKYKEPPKTDITVQKIWDDENDKDGIRPNSVTIEVYQNGVLFKTAELSATNDWQMVYKDLDAEDANGKPYNYTVDEPKVASGYTKTINGTTVTNKHVPNTTPGNGGGGGDDDDDDPTPPPTPRTYVEIPDEPVPMSSTPRLLENYIEILDEEVPLAGLPSEPGTGVESHRSLWAGILIASLGGLLILLHKDEEEAA